MMFKSRPSSHAYLGKDNDVLVKRGDIVHFDWGGENWGFIEDIRCNRGGHVLVIKNDKGFVGQYIKGMTTFNYPSEFCYKAR